VWVVVVWGVDVVLVSILVLFVLFGVCFVVVEMVE